MTDDKFKIVFGPGCFDGFDGTQEELDELVAEINRMVESGEIFEGANPVEFDDLPDEVLAALFRDGLTEEDISFNPGTRTLH